MAACWQTRTNGVGAEFAPSRTARMPGLTWLIMLIMLIRLTRLKRGDSTETGNELV